MEKEMMEFVLGLQKLQETNQVGYELVVETIHRLSEKQLEKEENK